MICATLPAMQRITWATLPAYATLLDIRDDLERTLRPLEALGQTPLEALGQPPLEVLHMAVSELEDGNPELPQTPLVVVCTNGRRSEYAAALLEALGAKQVYVLEGGLNRV
jgi:rhodanese-related sulfurtransferase